MPILPQMLPTMHLRSAIALAAIGAVASIIIIVAPPAERVRAQDMDDTPSTGKNKLHYPLAEEELGGLLKGAAAAAKEGDHERAVDLVRAVLDHDQRPSRSDRIVLAGVSGSGNDEVRRYVGATERAVEVLRALPPAAVQVFRKRYDHKARNALDDAREQQDPIMALSRAYDRYPISTWAPAMLEAAADRAFENGDFERARRFYVRARRDLIELPPPAPSVDDPPAKAGGGDASTPTIKASDSGPPAKAGGGAAARVRGKLIMVLVGLGRAEDADLLAREAESEDKDARFGLDGAALKRDDLVAVALKQRAIRRGEAKGSSADFTQARGDAQNRSVVERPVRVGAARYTPHVFDHTYESGVGMNAGEATISRNLPLIFGDSLFVTTAERLRARRLADGEDPRPIPRIPHPTPPYSNERDDNTKVLFSGAIDRGFLVAPYLERVQDEQSYRGIPIKVRIPFRKLAAFDLDRWRWKWDHRDTLEGTKLARGSFPAPPVASEGVLYAPAWTIEGWVHCYGTAFDTETGAPRWTTWLASGQVEQTMFGELAREPLSLPVAVAEGTVFDCTCFGAVVALDAETGRPRWVSEYDQIPISAAKGYYPDPRNLPWEANPPIVENGVLIVAPLDSKFYYGFDVADGKILWSYETSPAWQAPESGTGVRFVMGADQGKVIVASRRQLFCRDVRSGKLLWQSTLAPGKYVGGRGLIAAGKVLIPTFPGDVAQFDLASGASEGSRAVTLPGNLAVAGDSVVIVGDGQFVGFQNEPPETSTKSRDF